MHNPDVIHRATPHQGTSATISREDALSERMGMVMLWLIPVLAFLLAIFSIR